jgi:hypothetical protein
VADETLRNITIPTFEVTRHLVQGSVQLTPVPGRLLKYCANVITLHLTFEKDGRTEEGELLPEDLEKSDEELDLEKRDQELIYKPEWTHDLSLPLFDLNHYRGDHPTQLFPTWYEQLLGRLSAYVNGSLLGEPWRLESLETHVPHHLGGIVENRPVEMTTMERGYRQRHARQSALWASHPIIMVDGMKRY